MYFYSNFYVQDNYFNIKNWHLTKIITSKCKTKYLIKVIDKSIFKNYEIINKK